MLLTSMVRPSLEYAAFVCCPHKKRNITKFVRVQIAIVKIVPELNAFTQEETLGSLEILAFKESRKRDLIDGMENVTRNVLYLDTRITMGYSMELKKEKILRSMVSPRIVNEWNKLKEETKCQNCQCF